MAAANDGYSDTVQVLLSRGADLNAKAKDGATAITIATSMNHPDIVKLLKSAGAKE